MLDFRGVVVAFCGLMLAAGTPPPISQIPQRIVAIGPSTAEIVCALGACDRIVGVSKFCVYPPELSSRPRVGGLSDPDLERIAALRPDLLLLRGRVDSLERLGQRLGVTVYYDETDTLAGIERCVLDLGRLLGCDEQATIVNERFRRQVDDIRRRTAGKPRPRVLLTVSREPQRLANLLTAGQGSFLSEMIEAAGGTNVFGDVEMPYPQVSLEAVIAKQPEVIIELMPEAELSAEAEASQRAQWSGLGSLPAVRSNRVYFITIDHSLIPSPRFTEVISLVADFLHPLDRAVP